MKNKTFGSYLRSLRLDSNIGLREFAGLLNMKPSNYSNMEQGKTPPPAGKELIDLICDTLGLQEDGKERATLFDLASNHGKRIPADVAGIVKEFDGIPVLVRTVDNKKLSSEQLRELIEHIKKNY